MPALDDPYFANTVTLIWRHDADGALGIVVNKPINFTLAEIFEELNISVENELSGNERQQLSSRCILAGGPVQRDKGFILHDSDRQWDSSLKIEPGISICTSRTILQDIASGSGPEQFMVVLGCAGWDSGQLETEMADNAWLTVPASTELVFSEDYDGKVAAAAASIGVELNQLSPAAGHS